MLEQVSLLGKKSRRLRAPGGTRIGAGLRFAIALGIIGSFGVQSVVLADRIASAESNVLRDKLAAAESVLYYRVRADFGVEVSLAPRARVLKLITHAVLPANTSYDPHRWYRYGLRFELLDAAGEVVWHHEIHAASRQSKADSEDGTWRQENAFSLDPPLELSDDRLLRVYLPDTLPDGARLRVYGTGPSPDAASASAGGPSGEIEEVLVRVYERTDRGGLDRTRRDLEIRKATTAVYRKTVTPWHQLSRDDRHEHVRHGYKRLFANGEPVHDYHLRKVYYTGFRLPVEQHTGDEFPSFTIGPRRDVALNIQGPTQLTLAARPVDATQRYGTSLAEIVITKLAPDGTLSRSGHRLRLDGQGSETLKIDEGLHGLRIATPDELELRVRVVATGRKRAQFGSVSLVPTKDGQLLLPDKRRLPVYSLSAETDPIRYDVVGDDFWARTFMLEVRAPLPTSDMASGNGTVKVDFLGADGERLGGDKILLDVHASRFERFRPHMSDAIPVSESQRYRFLAPRKTERVMVSADESMLLRGFTLLNAGTNGQIYESPYEDAELGEGVRWRYAPREQRRWVPLKAFNDEVLAATGRRGNVEAQVRIERPGGSDSAGELAKAHGLHGADRGPEGTTRSSVPGKPLGRTVRHRIVEPDLQGPAVPGGKGRRTRLHMGVRTKLLFPKGGKRSRIDWWLLDKGKREALGGEVEIIIDNEVAMTKRLTSSRGSWRLPQLSRGHHRIKLRGHSALAAYIDVPPASKRFEGELVNFRTVHRLTSRGLKVPVVKRADGSATLVAVLYDKNARSPDDVELQVKIGGGDPERRVGVAIDRLTVAERTLPMPAARGDHNARFIDRGLRNAGMARTVAIPLGEDLVGGKHLVHLRKLGRSVTWVRFYIVNGLYADKERAVRWSSTASPHR